MKNNIELTWPEKGRFYTIKQKNLIENPSLSCCANNPDTKNMLIYGDNLLVLKALEKDYTGRVKCIYIDPPYNIGKDNKHYKDNMEHSVWLEFMYTRLCLLKNLLSDDGFICCHIDDIEGAYLKVILDEIFGRQNYLNTFYIQVRYPNKTLTEDSDYHKIIEQCHVYSKSKKIAKLNRPAVEYDIEKFKWKIKEDSRGKMIVLGDKKVEIFKPGQYHIEEIEPSLTGLKETWATGSVAKGITGRFFELYLAQRKDIDGLGCLYKVEGIGEDGLGIRYIAGPKRANAKKGKFYSGIPSIRLNEMQNGASYKFLPVSNFCDFSANFGNCRFEGSVDFTGGKKPEALLKMILEYYSQPGDLILDAFLGSGTTAAVAHKMKRCYVGIENGKQMFTHCIPRLQKVIEGEQSGISKDVGWNGGGGFKFYMF